MPAWIPVHVLVVTVLSLIASLWVFIFALLNKGRLSHYVNPPVAALTLVLHTAVLILSSRSYKAHARSSTDAGAKSTPPSWRPLFATTTHSILSAILWLAWIVGFVVNVLTLTLDTVDPDTDILQGRLFAPAILEACFTAAQILFIASYTMFCWHEQWERSCAPKVVAENVEAQHEQKA